MIIDPAYCGYCLGNVAFNESTIRWEHTENGERVKADSPSDFVSAAHNRAGTPVNPADVEFSEVDAPITDSAGYLTCGCHGSQREHACEAKPEFNPADEI